MCFIMYFLMYFATKFVNNLSSNCVPFSSLVTLLLMPTDTNVRFIRALSSPFSPQTFLFGFSDLAASSIACVHSLRAFCTLNSLFNFFSPFQLFYPLFNCPLSLMPDLGRSVIDLEIIYLDLRHFRHFSDVKTKRQKENLIFVVACSVLMY